MLSMYFTGVFEMKLQYVSNRPMILILVDDRILDCGLKQLGRLYNPENQRTNLQTSAI